MRGLRPWWVSALLVLSTCGGRTALEWTATDENGAANFGGMPGIGAITATGGAAAKPKVVASVSAGTRHTCGINAAGRTKCWGTGARVPLGDDFTSDNLLVPNDVTGLSSGVLAISTGGIATACAITTGTLKCWGGGRYFSLASNSDIPADVEGLPSDIAAVSVGSTVACAVGSTGSVRCWGEVEEGMGISRAPVEVGLSDAVSVSAGFEYLCALTSGGAVKCWGRGDISPLNDDPTLQLFVPTGVKGLSSGVVAVSAGHDYACAVTSAGGVKCWGAIASGVYSRVPVDVEGLSSGVVSVSVCGDGSYTCAVTSAGAVKCWGSLMWGEPGDRRTTYTSAVPVDVEGLSADVISVSVGDSHACVVTSLGAVKCWGANDHGQLGDGSTVGSPVPVDVLGF